MIPLLLLTCLRNAIDKRYTMDSIFFWVLWQTDFSDSLQTYGGEC